jgi:hypothetical protein
VTTLFQSEPGLGPSVRACVVAAAERIVALRPTLAAEVEAGRPGKVASCVG